MTWFYRNVMAKGFTLVEFLTTFGILALLLTVAAASLRAAGPTLATRAAARTLAADLRYASELASSTQTAHALRLNPAGSAYALVRLADPEIIIKNARINETVRLGEITVPEATVVFNTLGATATPGIITLIHASGTTMLINVRPSGYVRIE
ncbi:hypothetical protein HYW17_01125 [Candidatus Uhrbacteria bacterium]|nr:hypothetical protein [Candidatus Uhrbacteria bacterium]